MNHLAVVLTLLLIGSAASAQDLSSLGQTEPVKFSGAVELRGTLYRMDGLPARREPFSWLLVGSPTLALYGVSIPMSFVVSEQERAFRQPFNQFGLSPTYRWATVHLGYRNVNFSPYTLGGHTMLGGGFELRPGLLRIGFMAGRLNRATVVDTTRQALVPYSFTRRGFAAKVGVGSESNYFDLSFLKAADDSTTIPDGVGAYEYPVSPAANSVLGYQLRLTLLRHFTLESDGAASVFTRDVNSPIALDSLDEPVLDRLQGFMPLNATSELNAAASVSLGYLRQGNGLKVAYKRIDPEFKSMGTYFFNSDLESWTLMPSAVLFKNAVRLNGSLGFQRDNIQNQKEASNRRVIGALNASMQFSPQFGLDLMYSNFSNDQKARTERFADSLRIVQTTQTLGVMPRFLWATAELQHVVSASANVSRLDDFNNYLGEGAQRNSIATRQAYVHYSVTFVPRQLTVYVGANRTALRSDAFDDLYQGVNAGANVRLFESALDVGVMVSFTQNRGESTKANILNTSLNASYRFSKHQRVRLGMFLTNNAPAAASPLVRRFTESRAELSYQLNF